MIPIWQRLIGVLTYILAWSDAIPFGVYLFSEYPLLKILAIPALPILIVKQAIPFGNLLIFLILFISVIRNPKISYFIRFNVLQSILLSIILLIIGYAFSILLAPLGNPLLIKTIANLTTIGTLCITIFSITKCILGEEPDLPGISDAVRMQI